MRRASTLGGALLLSAAPLEAQVWQSFTVERTHMPPRELTIEVRHDLGQISIKPARDSVRYRATLRYDARAVQPIYSFAADSGALRIGSREREGRESSRGRRAATLELTLGGTAPFAVDVRAGAAETDLDLTGLPVTNLAVSSGASDTRVRFDRPNPVAMKRLTLSTGAASIVADRLGNANAEEIVIRSTVGEVQLDLSGTWQRDAEVRAELTLGALSIRVPADVGVYVEASRTVASFSHPGLVERDGAYVSANWDSAPRKLRIYAQTVVGVLKVERR